MKLINARVPSCLLGEDGSDDLVLCNITLDGDRVAAIEAAAEHTHGEAESGTVLNCAGGIVVPAFVDMHTHLDSGHIAPRTPNPDGTFDSALDAVLRDRDSHWTPEEIRLRMEFALKSAYAHGTAAIRTHINSRPPVSDLVWPVFAALRDEWKGRLTLQAAALLPIDDLGDSPAALFDQYGAHGGMVGAFLYATDDVPGKLRPLLAAAEDRGADLDFHVDETLDPGVRNLAHVAAVAREIGFSGTITCGHCCSLMTMPESDAMRILDAVAAADVAIVSLPMCNLYLQDRDANARRTPRIRGGTLVHEMKARGIKVAIASDNTRDPFYAHGDLDMVEVWREATRILHLEHPVGTWPRAFNVTPATIMGLEDRDALGPGAPADLVVFKSRRFDELFARPQADRIVIRSGVVIDSAVPDYGELDGVG